MTLRPSFKEMVSEQIYCLYKRKMCSDTIYPKATFGEPIELGVCGVGYGRERPIPDIQYEQKTAPEGVAVVVL